jgi:Domain of unknown function (DUF4150)/GHH signature containing HNH/Endo VII superfamily nuclease toxin  2
MLKDLSDFKKSTGDEAATKSQGMNVITHQIQGKCYFTSWSMDVKIEGENAVRHLDMMTHNHASSPGGTLPWPYLDAMAVAAGLCNDERENEVDRCKDYKPNGNKDLCEEAGLSEPVIQSNAAAQAKGFSTQKEYADDLSMRAQAAANRCVSARRCRLVPYDAEKNGEDGCCPSQTPDHVVPKSSFYKKSVGGRKLEGWENYVDDKAPCMCAEGASNTAGSHGLRHAHHKASDVKKDVLLSFNDEVNLCVKGQSVVFSTSGCTENCVKEQLKYAHKQMGDLSAKVKHSPSGSKIDQAEIASRAAKLQPDLSDTDMGTDSDSDLSDTDTDSDSDSDYLPDTDMDTDSH